MDRPSRSTANKDPTAILRAHTQQCQTTAQKKADEAKEVTIAHLVQEQAAKEHKQRIAAIAALEDELRQDDITYTASSNTNRPARSAKKKTDVDTSGAVLEKGKLDQMASIPECRLI